MKIVTIDFETEEIVKGSQFPPRPVGVAVKHIGCKGRYYAWGHPSKNNCTTQKAQEVLLDLFKHYRCLFHHAKFDISVGMTWFYLPMPTEWEDSLFLAYLHNPRENSLKLKDLGETVLSMPPDEQKELRIWLITNYPPAKRAKTKWGKYIAYAPGDIVGKYAIGDVDRTEGLFKRFESHISKHGMMRSYETEKELMPVIMDMESWGIPISPKIHTCRKLQQRQLNRHDEQIRRKLGDINVNSGIQVFNAIDEIGLLDWNKVTYTKKDNPHTGREAIAEVCKDKTLVKHIEAHSRLGKLVGTYLNPWSIAHKEHGRFFPYFNQTRNPDDMGTRSGRLSSDFQQVPRERKKGYPHLRDYVIPEKDHTLVIRDFDGQEMRILAHYTNQGLATAFREDPNINPHKWTQSMVIKHTGKDYGYNLMKATNFSLIYGMGIKGLCMSLGISYVEAKELVYAHKQGIPEVTEIKNEINNMLISGILLRTWGGRQYNVEPPRYIEGEFRTFHYKMLNLLIQGSAADQMKRVMINYHSIKHETARILLSVHDEPLITCPTQLRDKEMKKLQEVMDDDTGWEVPMRSSGKTSTKSWGEAVPYEDFE